MPNRHTMTVPALHQSPVAQATAGKTVGRPFTVHFESAVGSEIADADALYLESKLLPATNAVLRQFIQVHSGASGAFDLEHDALACYSGRSMAIAQDLMPYRFVGLCQMA